MRRSNTVFLCHINALLLRPIQHIDLVNALNQVKASVSQQDLEIYLDWDKKYGASK